MSWDKEFFRCYFAGLLKSDEVDAFRERERLGMVVCNPMPDEPSVVVIDADEGRLWCFRRQYLDDIGAYLRAVSELQESNA